MTSNPDLKIDKQSHENLRMVFCYKCPSKGECSEDDEHSCQNEAKHNLNDTFKRLEDYERRWWEQL